MRRLHVPLLALLLAFAACTPAPIRGTTDTPEATPFDEAVEVVSQANFPVVIKYTVPGGGGAVYLGTVSPSSRATFVLPAQRIHLIAETEDGPGVGGEYGRSRVVTFRRIRAS